MTAPKRLRAVTPGDKPAKKLDVAQAAESGDHRALLAAMRDRIALAIRNPECPPRDLAALTRRLQDIAKEIEGIDARDAEQDEEAPRDDREVGAAPFDASAF